MPNVLKIAICEDEVSERDNLLRLLDKNSIKNTYEVFTKGDDLLSVFHEGKYDLILMDIYMDASITGIETVKAIRETDKKVPVAFVTTSKDHALESYRLSAMKYIEKPYCKESIDDILHLAQLKKNDMPSLFVQKNGIAKKIPFTDILYLEQQMHKVFICLRNSESFAVYGKLSQLIEQLPESLFFVPHKSFAVNLAYVHYINMEIRCFVLEKNINIPIRREDLGKSKKALENYMYSLTRGLMK